MTFAHRLFGSKNSGKTRPPQSKAPQFQRLAIEHLEARITPADVVVSSLLFRGDLTAEGNLWKATGKPVEVGFNPVGTEAFRSLVTLTGDTVLDPLTETFRFQGQGFLVGQVESSGFWQSSQLNTFDIAAMASGGIAIAGSPFTFGATTLTANTLALVDETGGDTSDSVARLTANGTLAFGSLSNGTDPTLPMALDSVVLKRSGPLDGSLQGKATGNFQAAASGWTVAGATFSYTLSAGVDQGNLSGNAQALIRQDTVQVNQIGLSITGGAIQELKGTVDQQAITLAGSRATLSGTLNLAGALKFEGKANLEIWTSAGLGRELFSYDQFSFSLADNTFSSLEGKFSRAMPLGLIPLKGLNLLAVQLATQLVLDKDPALEAIHLTGTISYAGVSFEGSFDNQKRREFTLTFGGDGLVIQDGKVRDWDAQIDGFVDLAKNTFEARETRLWHQAADNSYGFAGTLYWTVDGYKEFNNKFTEPANYFEINCGTREKPGILIVDGELRRVDVAISTKNGLIDIKGFTFRINNLGLVYEAEAGVTTRSWGLYGAISLNNRSSSLKLGWDPTQGTSVGLKLGDQANPGLLIKQTWSAARNSWDSDWDLRDLTFRFAGLGGKVWYGMFRLAELEVRYSVDPNDANISTLRVGVACSYNGYMLGGSMTFKDVYDETTNSYSKVVDGFSIKGGVDPGASLLSAKQGFLIAPGVYLMILEGEVKNLRSPENLEIIATATFSVGAMYNAGFGPFKFKDNGKDINTPVHTAIVRGQVSFTKERIAGTVDLFLAAYWDEANWAANLEPWKPLGGIGRGTFLIDWTNGKYEIQAQVELIQLIRGEIHLLINQDGIMVYASAQIQPTPYGRFDFFPVNLIDVSGSILLLSTKQQFVVGAWAKVSFFLFDATVGAGYDFNEGKVFLIDSDTVDSLLRWKDAFINGQDEYRVTQTYTVQADPGSAALYSSRITATIPFTTTTVKIADYTFANALGKNDILVEVPDTQDNKLPSGASFSYRVDLGQADASGFIPGTIVIDIFPNSSKALDYSKTFAGLGVDKLIVDLKVRLKQDSFFYQNASQPGLTAREVLKDPEKYLKGLNTSFSGASRYRDATWNNSVKVTIPSNQYGSFSETTILPQMATTVTVAPPTIAWGDSRLVTDELNSFTNTTLIRFSANPSNQTSKDGNVSLLVADEQEILAARWTVEQASDWFISPLWIRAQAPSLDGTWFAAGYLVEQQGFDAFETRDRRAENPYAGGSEDIGRDLLFFRPTGEVATGKLVSVAESLVTIRTESGETLSVGRDQAKPLWKRVTRIQLNSEQQPGTSANQVFTGSYLPTGYFQPGQQAGAGYDAFELFRVGDAVAFGKLPATSVDKLSPNDLKLPTLPSLVANLNRISTNPLAHCYPIDASLGIRTLGAGSPVLVTGLNGSAWTGTSTFALKDLNPSAGLKTASVTWLEKGLTATPKFAFLVMNDQINAAVYSDFLRFVPTADVSGRVLLAPGTGDTVPYAGLTVYLDLNNNGIREIAEPFEDKNLNGVFDPGENWQDLNGNGVRDSEAEPLAVTNAQGIYTFYAVAAGNQTLAFELPANRAPLTGTASLPFTKVEGQLVTLPDFTAKIVNPVLAGRVIVDLNQNGKADPGEPGLSHAEVMVTGPGGIVLRQYTDTTGAYQFVLDDTSMNGTVVISLPGTTMDPSLTITPTVPGANLVEAGVNHEKPLLATHDFLVQARKEFTFDPNKGILENLADYLNLFLEGGITAVSLRTSGFEFHVDRFKLLPFSADSQGIESAKGRAVFGGQTLNFEFVGPRGLVAKGLKLQEVNLRLSGDFDIFGAKLKLDNLAGKFVAGDATLGTSDRFQLTGSTSLEIDGNRVTVDLSNRGLVLSERGIESLDIQFTGALRLSGQDIDLGSLTAVYDRDADKLRLSGDTKILTLGSEQGGTYFGLTKVVMEITGGQVTTLQATLAGAMDIAGAKFSLEALTFTYIAAGNTMRLTGNSLVDFGASQLTVSLPDPGVEFSDAGIRIKGKVTGQAKLGNDTDPLNNPPVTLALDSLDLDYTDSSLRIAGKASVTVNKSQVALADADLRFNNGIFQSLKASASGQFEVAGAVVSLGQNAVEYSRESSRLRIVGNATVSLKPSAEGTGENDTNEKLVGISGAVTLMGQQIESIKATISTGVLTIAGAPLQIQSLGFQYLGSDDRFSITGQATLELLGGKLSAAFPAPGIVWRNGAFDAFHFKLSGELPLQKDSQGKAAIALKVEDLTAAYSDPEGSLTLKGQASLRVGGNYGTLETDTTGIVIVQNALQNFSAFLTLNLGFGEESFTDTNQNLVWDNGEAYSDANGNNRYDAGLSLNVTHAGFAYSAATTDHPSRLQITGSGVLDFDGPGPSKDGVALHFQSPGIELVDGQVENFSLAVAASFNLKALTFQPSGALGLRYQRAQGELAIFGGVTIQVATNQFGFTLGTSFDNPGLRLQNGAITYASAALTSNFSVGDLKFETKNAGFTFDGANDSWGIFGGVQITNVFSAGVSLGDQNAPGLLIRNNDWEITNLTLELGKITLGSFGINEAKLTIQRSDSAWSVAAKCSMQLPIGAGVGASGEFSLVNGEVNLISVTLASATGINIPNTPLFINYINGSIRNLTNLSQLTLSGSLGIGIGTQIQVLGKTAATAQFVGAFTLDPNSLRIQVDAYLGAVNSGTLTQPQWKGLLAQGTGVIFLDWTRGEYYADLSLSFLSGVFITSGRISFSEAAGLVFRSKAKLQIPEEVWLIGGTTLASADFLFVYNPAKSQFYAMAWGEITWWTRGLKYDVTKNEFLVLNGDEIQGQLDNAKLMSSTMVMDNQVMPLLQSVTVMAAPTGPRVSTFGQLTASGQTWEYSGQSTAIPVTEVTDGQYLARFQVTDRNRWAQSTAWRDSVRFAIDPVPGVEFQPVPVEFDPGTGIGSIGVRVLPLAGQYLPRGLTLRSRLTTPVELTGISGTGDPDLESTWTQAYAYSGTTPIVGYDQQGNPPPGGLQVRRGIFTVSFRPVADPVSGLATDWLESLRFYPQAMEGISFTVGSPTFDTATGIGTLTILAQSSKGTYLDPQSQFAGQLRSKVALASGRDIDQTGPDLGIRWETMPPVVDKPAIAAQVRPGIETTRLSGYVNDPRVTQVLVSLFYSTDEAGDQEYLATLAEDGSPADSIPVTVNADGTWSTEIRWDASTLPQGPVWLYGLVRDGEGRPPVYGESAGPFRVVHALEGQVKDPRGGYSGLPVFADLNSDGTWQTDEPRAITDDHGHYSLDLADGIGSTSLVFALPGFFQPVAGQSATRVVDLSHGQVQADLEIVPTQTIVRGSVFVTGDLQVDGYNDTLGQPVSGLGVVLTGSGGLILRATTNNLGQYELPVEKAGEYTLSLDLQHAEFLGFRLGEAPGISTTRQLTIQGDQPAIEVQTPLRVDSIGVVDRTDDGSMGSLDSLVFLSNQGYLSTIIFDEKLRGATLDIPLPTEAWATPYFLWDGTSGEWKLVQPSDPEEGRFGPSAFVLREDLRLDGGDLGITLREAGENRANTQTGFRAFQVLPGVEFLLENLTLEGFTAKGSPGQPGFTGTASQSGGGGGAGLGGAILNRGRTTLNHVRLVDNSAVGGKGGDSPVSAFLIQAANAGEGGTALARDGTFSQGGNGGGHLAGQGGQAIPVTLTYTLGDDPTLRTVTVLLAGAGGGGSGLGGAVYNAEGAHLTITGGTVFTGNSALGGMGGYAPGFITNLANALFGDSAHTVSVTGFEAANDAFGTDGSGLGGAIYNDGGSVVIRDSVLERNTTTDAGAALYAVGGNTVINTSAFRGNSSGLDQAIRFEGGADNQGSLEINRSLVLGDPNGPKAIVAEGGRRFGIGNVVTSQSGFAWGVLSTSYVSRPNSPFTGQPFIPAADGAPVDLGAPVTFITSTGVQAGYRIPFSVTTTVSNPAGVGVPTGRVLLGLDGKLIGEGLLNGEGVVSLGSPGLKAGRYSFDVYYEGDSIFAGSLGKTTVTVGTQTERIVEELYETHLGREADPEGLRTWTARIDGGMSVAEAVKAFRSSEEASQMAARTVERVYQELLNRLPDELGRDNWVRFLRTGRTERDLRAQVLASSEYTGSHSREDVINRLYATYLGREAEEAGMANWLSRWQAGLDPAGIATAIGNSLEAREVMVDELYRQILGREADQIGRKVWATSLASGMPLEQLEERLFASSEFRA